MTTPPIYMPGDDEYEEDMKEGETSTPTALGLTEHWTKPTQWDIGTKIFKPKYTYIKILWI